MAESVSMSLVSIMSTLFDLAQLERLSLPGPCLLECRPSALGCLHPCAVPSSAGFGEMFPLQALVQEPISASPTKKEGQLRRRHC